MSPEGKLRLRIQKVFRNIKYNGMEAQQAEAQKTLNITYYLKFFFLKLSKNLRLTDNLMFLFISI